MPSATIVTTRPVFVVFGDDWGRHVSSMQHLFRHIVPDHTVVWVNGIGHRAPRLTLTDLRRAVAKVQAMARPRPPQAAAAVTGPSPATILQPRVLPWHDRAVVRSWNRHALSRAIRRALDDLAPGQRPVLVTGSPPSESVVGHLGEQCAIYFCMDEFAALPGVDPEMLLPLERRLLGKVATVVATAEALVETKRPACGVARYLPQGVNFSHFATPRAVPADLTGLPRPIIGFAGGISDCVDFALLDEVAGKFPQGTVALLGPVTGRVPETLRPNIRFLGPRPYDILPAYVQAFDVGLIPYLLNDWTRAVDPLKLLEYLAAGIPVVTTALPEVQKYRAVIHIGSTPHGFVTAVAAALDGSGPNRDARQAEARRHGWAERARTFLGWVEDLVREETNTAALAESV